MNRQIATPTHQQKPTATFSVIGLLQRKCACGNHTMAGGECESCSNKKRLGLQTKLTINEPGDIYELEADRIADQVMAMPANSKVGGVPRSIQRSSGEPTGRRGTAPASVDQALASPGKPLEPSLCEDMEQRFGYDFSRVRVHTGAAAEQSARDVNATAYTLGHDVVFGAGEFAPGTYAGRRLIAHELTHVVQQSKSDEIHFSPSDEKHGLAPIHYITTRLSNAQIQRDRGAAGGCGICLGPEFALVAGTIAHAEIEQAFEMFYNIERELGVMTVPGDDTTPFRPSLDLAYIEDGEFGRTIYIGEIKPLDDAGRQHGAAEEQLRDYAALLRYSFDEVFRMTLEPPLQPYPFLNPNNPPNCPRQVIYVQLSSPGVYQYYCEPPWSELVRDPSCRCEVFIVDWQEQEQEQEQEEFFGAEYAPEPITIPDWALALALALLITLGVVLFLTTTVSTGGLSALAAIILILILISVSEDEEESPQIAASAIEDIPEVSSFMREHDEILARLRSSSVSSIPPDELTNLLHSANTLRSSLEVAALRDSRATSALRDISQIERLIGPHNSRRRLG